MSEMFSEAMWEVRLEESSLIAMFASTRYVCSSCTSSEQHHLWWYWHDHLRVPWQEHSKGYFDTIGEQSGALGQSRPITVQVFWADVGNGASSGRVAFVSMPSMLEDHELREAWESVAFSNVYQHCDADNFHLIINAIEARGHVQIYDRDRARRVQDALAVEDPFRVDALTDDHDRFTLCERRMVEWAARADFFRDRMRNRGAG